MKLKFIIFILLSALILAGCSHFTDMGDHKDLAVLEVIGPPNAQLNRPEKYQVLITNEGTETVDGFMVQLFKQNGVELFSVEATSPLAAGDTASYDFQWTPTLLERTHLFGKVILTDDENADNDVSSNFEVKIYREGEKQILIVDRDNDATFIDPDYGRGNVNCNYGLAKALHTNDYLYDNTTEIPKILYNYDIVFIELGIYCPT